MFGYSESLPGNSKAMKMVSLSKSVYDLFIQNKITDKTIVERAKSSVASSLESLPAMIKATALDSLAHLQVATGDLAGAVESQKRSG